MHVGGRERGIESPAALAATKTPTSAAQGLPSPQRRRRGIKTTGSSPMHHCNWHHGKVAFFYILTSSGNLIHHQSIQWCVAFAFLPASCGHSSPHMHICSVPLMVAFSLQMASLAFGCGGMGGIPQQVHTHPISKVLISSGILACLRIRHFERWQKIPSCCPGFSLLVGRHPNCTMGQYWVFLIHKQQSLQVVPCNFFIFPSVLSRTLIFFMGTTGF